MKLPVGPQTLKKAANTEAGKLACLLNRVLYVADKRDVQISSEPTAQVKKWVAPEDVYKGNDPLPSGMPVSEQGSSYCNTEALMRAIRDYLEFKSFEEVIP
jgi:hypothetical protein